MAKGLSKATIVDAAFDVLDDGGIDAVTVRAVATKLSVKAPALYWHVSSKQALLDEMGTQIQRRVMEALGPASDGDWQADLTAYGRVLRAEYLAHRDGARTFSGTRLTDPDVLRAQEPWLLRWVDAGFTLDEAAESASLVTAFVVGFVIEEQERSQGGDRYSLADRDREVGEGFPSVQEAGRALYADPNARFERNLATVVAGVGVTLGSR